VERRLVTIARPGDDGSREVLEILELRNPGRATRIAPDTLQPTWSGALPAAALQFEVQQSDFSAEAVLQRGAEVVLYGPVQPDHGHQLSYRYVLSKSLRTFALPIDQPTTQLALLVEDTLASVGGAGLVADGMEPIEQRRFARYLADSIAGGTVVTIAFPAGAFRGETLLPYLVMAVAVALGAGLWVALKGERGAGSGEQSSRGKRPGR
jgi:hypothetical protein